jgi:pimeloyl-ACP methyl ester carboxylesterase
MPEVASRGVRISYDVVGEGRPLVLLRGWCCDRSWWTEPGYIDELRSDHRLVNVDLPGHGASDKPHEAAAYSKDALIADVFAVADAEGLDRFAIWGQSYGGRIAWMTAAAAAERVPAIVSSGMWDPRIQPEQPTETDEWNEALRHDPGRGPQVVLRPGASDRRGVGGRRRRCREGGRDDPNGQSQRLSGLGHGGACAASALTVPTARAFFERWFAR